ncbi:MAG: mRNA surveillance protein pelota [Sulfolobales archaeon]
MKIVSKDLKRGIIRIKVEDEDDLWVLKTIVREGDVIVASTLRDVKIDGEGKRRLPMKLSIRVKNVYFQPFSSRLRIHGIIIESPEEYGLKGSHHTFNIDVGTELEIIKDSWAPSELRRLERNTIKGLKALLVALDFDEISIALLYDQGIKYLVDRSMPTFNKDSGNLEELVSNATDLILKSLSNVKCDVVVIASPAFLKDLVAMRLDKAINVKVFKDSISCGGRAGIEELVKRDSVKNLLKEVNIVESEKVFEEFMELLLRKPSRTAYGIDEVKLAATSNAVAKLLVLEELLSGERFEEVEEILSLVEEKGGTIRIVGSESSLSSRLRGMGGIIAVLRYDFIFNR